MTRHLDVSMAAWDRLYTAFNTSPERYPVHLWRHEKIDVWPIIKTQFMLRACNLFHADKRSVIISKEERSKSSDPMSKGTIDTDTDWGDLTELPASPINDFASGFNRPSRTLPVPVADFIMFGAAIGSNQIGGYEFQHLLDPLRASLEEEGVRTSLLLTDVAADAPQLRNSLIGGVFGVRDQFNAMRTIYMGKNEVDFDGFVGFAEWYSEINAIWPIDQLMTRGILSSVVRQTLSCYLVLSDYFRMHRIKGVATYAFYGLLGHASAAACRDLDIPFYDVQHGVAGAGHESYSWPNLPPNGYNTLPTDFLCWGDYEANSISDSVVSELPRTHVVGHPWRLTEQMFEQTEAPIGINLERFSRAREAFQREELSAPRSDVNILVSLYTDQPSEFIKQVIEQAPEDWSFWIRLHPGEVKREGAIEKRSLEFPFDNVNISEASSVTLPELLKKTSVHLTKYSSTVLDALAFGVPSVCFSPSASWYYPSDSYDAVICCEQVAETVVSALAEAHRAVRPEENHAVELRDFVRQTLKPTLGTS